MSVRLHQMGAPEYLKASWPVRYGLYHEIKTRAYRFQFSPEGVVRFIQGCPGTWHNHSDWFKRTPGGDWVYYSSGGYNGAASALGEHYIPVFAYGSNGALGERVFPSAKLEEALEALDKVLRPGGQQDDEAAFLETARTRNTPEALQRLAKTFHGITHGVQNVLPPDSRHVDYDVLPVRLVQGCLYRCRFCGVKEQKPFGVEPEEAVKGQVEQLCRFFAGDLKNLGGVFLGGHDALAAGASTVLRAASWCEPLVAARTLMGKPWLFLFASPHSLLSVDGAMWNELSQLPWKVQINMGVESLDSETLAYLGRPTPLPLLKEAIAKADAIQKAGTIGLSINMVLGENLPPGHAESLRAFASTRRATDAPLYLSPLKGETRRKPIMDQLVQLKRMSKAPVHLYLLQRL